MYITTAQLIKQFGEQELIQRTDREPYTGAINQLVLDELIGAAERRIDGYLRKVYTLPLGADVIAGSALSEICGALVRYALYKDTATDEVTNRYKDAIAWLRDVRSGLVTLGVADAEVAETGTMVVRNGVSRMDWDSY